MQEMKRRYASMYIPAETVDDQFNEHCGVCDEQGIEEAVLADRDYKYDGKVIKISKKNFSKVHRDFKNSTKGQEMMMTYDDKAGTVSVPVEFTEEVAEAKGTAYPATIDTLKMIVKDKQNQIVMFKSGQARVDSFTASAMVAVYDAMKPATKKKFEEMIKDKGGFMKTQAFAMKMTEDTKWIDQIKEDPSMLELHYSLVQIDEAVHDKKSTFTMAPFEDLRGVADVALKIMQRQPLEVKEEEQEVTSEETPQKLTE